MRRIGKILLRIVLALFVLVYCVVALVNYSVVQSVIGSVASSHFSKEWGGKVSIGSMGCNPMNHLVLRNVELITPENDTICTARKIALRFDGFPFDSHGLTFSKVQLSDVYYHLGIDSIGTNLQFIIDYYAREEETTTEPVEFKVLVDDLVLDNVCYRQDLEDDRDPDEWFGEEGVDIKHMEYRNIRGRFRNVRVDLDRVTCRIDRLTTTERSGLTVKDMHANVYATQSGIGVTNLYLETEDSKLMGDVLMDYRHWESMGSFLDSVFFTVHFDNGSYGGMQDAAYWANALWGMNERIYLQGDFSGPISDFKADNLKLAFGNESTIELDAYIYGLPNIDTTIIGADIHHLHTTYDDLAGVRHPAGVTLQAEKILKRLNNIDLEASFTGTIYDFYATIGLDCDQGSLNGDVVMSRNLCPRGRGRSGDSQKNEYRYTGQVSSTGFNIGRIAPNEWVSHGGFDLTFEGTGFDPKTMNASAEGQLHHLVVKGQRLIGEVALEADATGGQITLDASIDDVIAALSVHGEGDWREDSPVYRAEVDVQHLNMKRFGLWDVEGDSVAEIAFHATGRHTKTDDANSSTRVSLRDLHLLTSSKDVRLRSLVLSSRMQNLYMNTTLRSDLADANLRGYYKYATLPALLRQIVSDYVPRYFDVAEATVHKVTEENSKTDGRGRTRADNEEQKEMIVLADSRFEFNMEWKDTAGVLSAFVPKLGVATGTTIQANYNYADGFKPIVRSDSLRWGDLCFYDVGMNGEAIADHYKLQMKSDRLMLGQLQLMDFGTIRMESSHESMACRLLWQNSSQTVGGGDVNLRLLADSDMVRLVVDPSHLALGGRDWNLTAEGDNYASPKEVHVERIGLASDNQRVMLSAQTHKEGDSIMLLLSNLGLDVLNPFLSSTGIYLGGIASGSVTRTKVTTGDLNISDLALNGEQIGDLVVQSSLDDNLQRLNLTAHSIGINAHEDVGVPEKAHEDVGVPEIAHEEVGVPEASGDKLFLDGYTSLVGEDPELHFDVQIGDVGLGVIKPFVSSFSSRVEGTITSDLAIRGTVSKPVATGLVSLHNGLMNIDFLNVAYTINDTIVVDSTDIRFNNFTLHDPEGGSADISGRIDYKDLSNMRLSLKLASSRLLCMNTTSRDNAQFYGHVVASADGRVRGTVNNLQIVLDARTLEGTTLTVPINDKRQMEQVDYIHFVSEDYDELTLDDLNEELGMGIADPLEQGTGIANPLEQTAENEQSRYNLTINIEVTPDLQFSMPMDFSTIEADVRARGSGDLQLTLGTGRDFGVAGLYEIDGGTLMLDLLGVVSKEFTIDDGSSITLPGNLMGAMFDIRAVLSQRVNLSTLTGTLSSTDSQKPIQVENVIALSGTLQSPDISFDLRLPGADQSVQEEVFSYIDRNNERDMLTQTVSLLVTKSFYNASASGDLGGSTTTGSQAYGLVMGTLGSVLTDMVQFVNVSFDYQSGNDLTTDQYAVDISKEWNKFYFETSLGFGGESREMATSGQGTNNMTGDMLVGYKINPRLHLFVFNRSNTNDYTRSDLPYKQGMGLKYTRDFDRFGDLFRRKKAKK